MSWCSNHREAKAYLHLLNASELIIIIIIIIIIMSIINSGLFEACLLYSVYQPWFMKNVILKRHMYMVSSFVDSDLVYYLLYTGSSLSCLTEKSFCSMYVQGDS